MNDEDEEMGEEEMEEVDELEDRDEDEIQMASESTQGAVVGATVSRTPFS